MPNETTFKAVAGIDDLARIRDFIDQRSAILGLDPDTTYDVKLSVVELVTNSMLHGYHGQPGYVEIEIDRCNDKILIHVRDQAAPFDPTQMPPPDFTRPLEERRFGGMGIYLVKHFVDEMKYYPLPLGGNQVTLVINKKK